MDIDIVCSCDSAFLPHLAVLLLSISDTNPNHNIRVFILADAALAPTAQVQEQLSTGSLRLSFLEVPASSLQDLFISGHVSKATYARLLIGEMLPPDVAQVLYLDSDMLVRGDIGDLWQTDLRGKTAGAVLDLPPYTRQQRLGMPANAPYFNGGMLLIDLKRWRDLHIGDRALEFAAKNQDRLTWHDQCALNFLLVGDWLLLDEIWNYQTLQVGHYCEGLVRFDKVDRPALDRARIVHFNSPSKPWHYLNDHPLKKEYLRYRQRTPWPLERFQDRYPHNIIRRFLLNHLPALLPTYLRLRKYV